VSELASHLGLPRDDVVEATLAGRAYSALSLHRPLDDKTGSDPVPFAATVGALDGDFALIENRQCVRPLIEALSPRLRAVLVMRFFESLTQSQIATRTGVSQMHVSRLLAHALAQLCDGITDG
jgi:RNA polymerase sigma-B factor